MSGRNSSTYRALVLLAAAAVVGALASTPGAASASQPAAPRATSASSQHLHINCEYSRVCPDIADSEQVFGADEYVGHDEPSLLFYSNKPGSGNRSQYTVTLPNDPTPAHPTHRARATTSSSTARCGSEWRCVTPSPTRSRCLPAHRTATATSWIPRCHPSTRNGVPGAAVLPAGLGAVADLGRPSARAPAAPPSGVPR